MARILAVEDDPDVLRGLSEILRREGHDVFEAKDGVEALRLMKNTSVDIILTDVYMPDMDGIELMLRVYRAHASTRTIFIVISGGGIRPMDETLESAQAAGAFRTLEKPFTREEILEAVDAAVRELESGGGAPAGGQSSPVG